MWIGIVLIFAFAVGHMSKDIPNQEGTAPKQLEEYETALQKFQPLAEQGDVRAQIRLGTMYEKGQGVPKNVEEAVKWYKLAAEHHNPHPTNSLLY